MELSFQIGGKKEIDLPGQKTGQSICIGKNIYRIVNGKDSIANHSSGRVAACEQLYKNHH
jgi:hypothetical protein